MSFANAFASGVLLAAGLVCMLPDATELLCKMCAYVCAGAAIIVLIMVEEVAMVVATAGGSKSKGSITSLPSPREANFHPGDSTLTPSISSKGTTRFTASSWAEKMKGGGRYFTNKLRLAPKSPPQGPAVDCCSDKDCYQFMESDVFSQENLQSLSCDGAMLLSTSNMSTSKAICLFAALSFHSIMEGVGLGTTKKEAMLASISVAILAHKSLAAFALGTALCKSSLSSTQTFVMANVFAIGTPFGIAIGTIVSNNVQGPAVSICTAFAAGTFLQVSMMEIIPSVLQPVSDETPCTRVMRCFLIAFGFGMMCLTIYLVGG